MIVKEAERIILKLLSYVTNEDKNSGKYECTVQIEAAVAHKHPLPSNTHITADVKFDKFQVNYYKYRFIYIEHIEPLLKVKLADYWSHDLCDMNDYSLVD
ncbi:unnamed protein product [Rhizophagus irregularis]|nr:unnamed protein product [Rhizophagus irregularis]CAB5343722.1 unnamed protein product [Rhizophagus irregularis]